MSSPHMDYFRAIQNSTGVQHIKDAKVAAYNMRFAADFDTSINVVHNALRNDLAQDFIIVPTDTGCDIWARPGETFYIGDIIYYNTLHWLVTDINFNDDLNRSGKMVRCNRQIRWQNKSTGEIVERWCLATKPYTSNINEGLSIATSNREFKIQLTYDEETLLVDLDRRFLLEVIDGTPKAYQVTSVDTITNRYQDADGGFIVWNLKQCEYNAATDNAELMIADYVEKFQAPAADETLLPCSISGRDAVRCGTARVYKPMFYEADGVTLDESVEPTWTIDCDSAGVHASFMERNLILNVDDDDTLEGTKAIIGLTDTAGRYSPAAMQVEVIGVL